MFAKLSEALVEDIEKHMILCRYYPRLMDLYAKKMESEFENEKLSDYLTDEYKERQMRKIWEKIRTCGNDL